MPDEGDGWEFVERMVIGQQELDSENKKTLRIWDERGTVDQTKEASDNEARMIIIFIPELKTVSPATTWKINTLFEVAENEGIGMIGVVSGTPEQIEEWRDLSMPDYRIYTADDTSIKEVARGNPSVVYIENGIIEGKSTLSSIDINQITENQNIDISVLKKDYKTTLYNFTLLYLICLIVLIASSLLPRIKN